MVYTLYVTKSMSRSASMTVDEVMQLLGDNGYGEYANAFKYHNIAGDVLHRLKDKHLKELGVKKIGDRLRILALFEGGPSTSVKVQKSAAPVNKQPPMDRSISTPGQDWEKKRRQMMMRRMQNEKDTQETAPEPKPVPKRPPGRRDYNDDIDSARRAQSSDSDEPPPPPKPRARAQPKPKVPSPPPSDESDEPPPPKARPKPQQRPPPPPPPEEDEGDDGDRRECAYCGRKFAADRIEKHEAVCARAASRKVKVFDSKKQRTQGTEAAQFARNPSKDPPKKPQSNFRAQHEKLVESLRAARKYQAYEKAKEEGRAVGPPPEMPKYEPEDDDRVSCPYCGRKFGEEAAKRHITVCERMNAGKARGGARGRGRR